MSRTRGKGLPIYEGMMNQAVRAPLECVGITLADLDPGMCRWPIGDPRSEEFRYCGAPAAKSWCAHHHAIAYQSADDRARWDRRRTLGVAVA
jgi:hypothetical protein